MRIIIKLLRVVFWGFMVSLTAGGVIAASFYLYFSPHLPAVEQLRELQLETPLRIYSSDNKLIAEFGEKRRTPIAIDETPPSLLDAFLAAEDSRFYEHQGVDLKGIARAVLQLVSTGRIQTGGSTITMQAAKNFFLSQERTFTRKFKEILLALKIEQALEKDEILELYINKIYLGNRAYGVEAAANVYYGKSTQDLSIAQMAMIAGLPKAPSKFNPLVSPDRALIRRNWILDRMLTLGMIDQQQHTEARTEGLTASYHGSEPDIEAPYIAEMARQEIVDRFGVDAYSSGMQVILTINSRLQTAADEALKKGLLDYSRRHGYRGIAGKLETSLVESAEALEENLDEVLGQLQPLPEAKGLVPAVVTAIGKQSATVFTEEQQAITLDWQALRWTNPYFDVNKQGKRPTTASQIVAMGDIVYVSYDKDGYKLAQLPQVQGALAAVSPKDGAILALVGGFDFNLSKFNRATQAQRQAGSNFKPFVYLSALENGSTAATLINDAPVVFEDSKLETAWRPENYSENFYGPTRLRKALYSSRNLVSIRLLQKTGIAKTINYVERLGFDRNRIPNDLSLALGTAEFTPLELAIGYATLANGGFRVHPYLIKEIREHRGQVLFASNPATVCVDCEKSAKSQQTTKPADHSENLKNQTDAVTSDSIATIPVAPIIAEKVADPRAVYIINSILQDVIKRGTGTKAKALKRSDLAGKTGTTNDQVDAWFSGYNGNIAASVWVGFDQPSTLGRSEYGSKAALPIWIDFMEVALKDSPETFMQQPRGLVTVRIDNSTGDRAMPGQKDTSFEIFRVETAPKLTVSGGPVRRGPTSPAADDAPPPELLF